MNAPDLPNHIATTKLQFRSTLFRRVVTSAVALSIACAALVAESRVTRFVVEDRQPYAGGESFGTSGPFERLTGTAYMEVDPHHPLNAVIVNLDNPRNWNTEVYAVAVICLILTTAATGARLYSRAFVTKKLHIEDCE